MKLSSKIQLFNVPIEMMEQSCLRWPSLMGLLEKGEWERGKGI